MLTVIFGAGASFDSINERDIRTDILTSATHELHLLRPPLANDLFRPQVKLGQVLDKYHQMRPIIPRLRDAAATGRIEECLDEIKGEADEFPEHTTDI